MTSISYMTLPDEVVRAINKSLITMTTGGGLDRHCATHLFRAALQAMCDCGMAEIVDRVHMAAGSELVETREDGIFISLKEQT